MICAFLIVLLVKKGHLTRRPQNTTSQLHQFLILTHPIHKNKMLSFCWFNEWKDVGGYMAMEGF